MISDKKVRVPLTSSEFIVLRLLIANNGKFVERTEMARVIGRSRMSDQSRALDVLVSRLRSKIKKTGSTVTIKNVRGLGYAIY
jgi:DNA-binding response OmpR family regulator